MVEKTGKVNKPKSVRSMVVNGSGVVGTERLQTSVKTETPLMDTSYSVGMSAPPPPYPTSMSYSLAHYHHQQNYSGTFTNNSTAGGYEQKHYM